MATEPHYQDLRERLADVTNAPDPMPLADAKHTPDDTEETDA